MTATLTRSKLRKPAATKATKTTGALSPAPAVQPVAPAPAAPSTQAAAATPKGKLGALVALLSRPQGATIAEMMELTSWQQHSVRGALAGTIKKKFGYTLSSQKTDGERVYRIEVAA